MSPDIFKEEYWEKQPLVVSNRGAHYDSLFSLAAVDDILATGVVRSSRVRVVRDGNDVPINKVLRGGWSQASALDAVYAEYRAGATIVLQFLQDTSKALSDLCRTLAEEFSATFQVNAYLTPPHSQGLSTHYDTHDVFVLQIHGSKQWRVFETPLQLPLRGQPFKRAEMDPGRLIEEVELWPGDVIYMPRGFMHDAATVGTTSLHLTVGAISVTWASVILGAVEACIDQEPSFRASLPPGFANDEALQVRCEHEFADLIHTLCARVDAQAAITDAIERGLLGQRADSEGLLLDLESEAQLSNETRVRRRRGVQWRLTTEGDELALRFNGKVVRIPAYAEAELQFVTHADEFTAGTLPGAIDEAGRILLIRNLLREGFLTICR